jgi:hypothetical protein
MRYPSFPFKPGLPMDAKEEMKKQACGLLQAVKIFQSGLAHVFCSEIMNGGEK